MNERNDNDLRPAFDALKRRTSASVPSFASLTSDVALTTWRKRRQRRRAAIVAAVLLPAVFIFRPHRSEPDFERFKALTGIDPGQVSWRAPTDVLLDVPGRDLLRRVPLIEIQAPRDRVRPADSTSTRRRSSS